MDDQFKEKVRREVVDHLRRQVAAGRIDAAELLLRYLDDKMAEPGSEVPKFVEELSQCGVDVSTPAFRRAVLNYMSAAIFKTEKSESQE